MNEPEEQEFTVTTAGIELAQSCIMSRDFEAAPRVMKCARVVVLCNNYSELFLSDSSSIIIPFGLTIHCAVSSSFGR